MCGRYVCPTRAEIERHWGASDGAADPLEQRFDASPADGVRIVLLRTYGRVDIDSARWGLVPSWWKQATPPPFTFNTRMEDAASKPMWRTALKASRCLVPAIGWYEWKAVGELDPDTGKSSRAKQPWFMHLPGKRLLHFAALMSRHGRGDAAQISCSILTRAAEGPAADVNERMPVVLPEEAHRDWLDRRFSDSEKSLALAEEKAIMLIELEPVSLSATFPNPA
jgi:putative SOS response-associated peptidase YedK